MRVIGIDQIVSVDLSTFELSLTPFAKTIDVFDDIIVRDKGSKGDAQGRKKARAIAEISYCYLMEKYGTIFFNWEESRRHNEVVRRLKVDIQEDDPLIIALRSFIKTAQRTPSFEALTEVKESYHSSTKMLRILRRILESQIEELTEKSMSPESFLLTLENGDGEEQEMDIFAMIDKVDKLLGKIKSNALDFNKILTLIKDLEEKVQAEQQEERIIRGGGTVTDYER
jgi:hypothetical protein